MTSRKLEFTWHLQSIPVKVKYRTDYRDVCYEKSNISEFLVLL